MQSAYGSNLTIAFCRRPRRVRCLGLGILLALDQGATLVLRSLRDHKDPAYLSATDPDKASDDGALCALHVATLLQEPRGRLRGPQAGHMQR